MNLPLQYGEMRMKQVPWQLLKRPDPLRDNHHLNGGFRSDPVRTKVGVGQAEA